MDIKVLIPAIDMEATYKTVKQLKFRAGIEAQYFILPGNIPFIEKVNAFVRQFPADYYVYTATDAFAGRNWLKIAYEELEATGKSVFAFNDGKWGGRLAAFGMVRASYMSPFFFDGYKDHYADVELTLRANIEGVLACNLEAILMEVDYDKDTKSVNQADRDLFMKRQEEIYNVKEWY